MSSILIFWINVNVHASRQVHKDVYYKHTNNHDYPYFKSHHPSHTRNNIPYNLAKRIIVFCSDFTTEELCLSELQQWLLDCNYPSSIIQKGFKNAKLHGPTPDPSLKITSLPFFTTYYSNFSSHNIRNVICYYQNLTVIESTMFFVTKELYWSLNSQEIYSDI